MRIWDLIKGLETRRICWGRKKIQILWSNDRAHNLKIKARPAKEALWQARPDRDSTVQDTEEQAEGPARMERKRLVLDF